jgi:hypothetical protein
MPFQTILTKLRKLCGYPGPLVFDVWLMKTLEQSRPKLGVKLIIHSSSELPASSILNASTVNQGDK